MGYTVVKHNQAYGPRAGLEGPFHYPNGRVLYYDPKAGEYWDPRTDWYVPSDEVVIFVVENPHKKLLTRNSC